MSSKKNTFLVRWLAPAIAAGLIFLIVRPTLAQIGEPGGALAQFLATNNVEVGSETVDGYRQVYYEFGGHKTFVTEGKLNSRHPVSQGEYMAWETAINGAGQIFFYHIPTNIAVQVTTSSTNLQPQLSGGLVVWERWIDDRWHIFLFDSIRMQQITSGDVAINADIEGIQIVFARQNDAGAWRAEMYNIATGKLTQIGLGIGAKRPRLRDGQVFFRDTGPALVTETEPSPTLTPTSTPSGDLLSSPSATPSLIPTSSPVPSPSPEPELVSEPPLSEEPEFIPELPLPFIPELPLPIEMPDLVTEDDIIEELSLASPI